jgi:hypothetical protein
MKVELLCLGATIKSSHISDDVMEIPIIYILQGMKPDNTTHMVHEDTTSGHSSQ